MAMSVFEAVGFYSMTICVGLLQDPVALAGHAIAFLLMELSFIIPFGFSIALGCHIGNLLGKAEGERALRVAFFGVTAILVQMYIHCAIIWTARYEIVKAWSPSSKLANIGSVLVSIASVAVVLDGYQFTSSAVLKAVGRQSFGAVINFITYYLISIPGGVIFAIVLKKGVLWFWWFLIIALAFSSVCFTIYIFRIDWDEEVKLTAERVKYVPKKDNSHSEGAEVQLDESDDELEKIHLVATKKQG